MPSTSADQHRLMEAAAHDPAVAKKRGVAQAVAREFVAADKRKRDAVRRALEKRRGKTG